MKKIKNSLSKKTDKYLIYQVRVGGGWDTLENYLNKHDPCRCETEHGKLMLCFFLLRSVFQ